MEFDIKQNAFLENQKKKYIREEVDIAYDFAKLMTKEFKDLIKAIVLFGSTARKNNIKGDIDILVIIDDIFVDLTRPVVQGYRILTAEIINKVSPKIHVTSMRVTSFWEYVRLGDPIAINILREGIGILDTGIFNPVKYLLYKGKIKPSKESVFNYINRASFSFNSSRNHLLAACMDLYWATIDSAEAALMANKVIPPSPDHIYFLLEKEFVSKGFLSKELSLFFQELYHLNKKIEHNELRLITGQEYSALYHKTKLFIEQMEFIVKKKNLL